MATLLGAERAVINIMMQFNVQSRVHGFHLSANDTSSCIFFFFFFFAHSLSFIRTFMSLSLTLITPIAPTNTHSRTHGHASSHMVLLLPQRYQTAFTPPPFSHSLHSASNLQAQQELIASAGNRQATIHHLATQPTSLGPAGRLTTPQFGTPAHYSSSPHQHTTRHKSFHHTSSPPSGPPNSPTPCLGRQLGASREGAGRPP